VEICGSFTEWGVQDDYKMTYLADSDSWVIRGVTIPKGGQWKFRMNDDSNWTANLGYGTLDDLKQGGDNIADTEPGVYTIELFIGTTPYHATLTKTGEADAPTLPETMYLIGDGVGGWDWEANGQDMIPVNGKAGQFWAIRYIEAGKGFKFCPVKEWAGDFYSLGEDSGFTVADGNCFVAENGVYMIYVDTDNKKICVEPAKVYGKGDCFGGWEADPVAFTIEGDKVVGKTTTEGDIRLYADSSIATSDWWTREFVFFDGKIAYRGNGDDQERVKVEAGKTVTLDFNAGTAVVE
jgi:hypothetical protein